MKKTLIYVYSDIVSQAYSDSDKFFFIVSKFWFFVKRHKGFCINIGEKSNVYG